MREDDLPGDGGGTADVGSVVSDDTVVVSGVDTVARAQELLAEHVPLTLLVDLLAPTGETSAELLEKEGLPEDVWWSPPVEEQRPGA